MLKAPEYELAWVRVVDPARELAYRLYSICERKKRSADGQRYNALVSSWPALVRLAQNLAAGRPSAPTTGDIFAEVQE
ncbi:MAG: hypothetical protein KGJ62_06735 [Armatimonadetes bacterium]|nr:hypothetical protein [Armatimonadota bacterium]MDE2207401.1 hypothetical protein [Armatimonadota bacterium]